MPLARVTAALVWAPLLCLGAGQAQAQDRVQQVLLEHRRPDAGVLLLRFPRDVSQPFLTVERLQIDPALARPGFGTSSSTVVQSIVSPSEDLALPPSRYRIVAGSSGATPAVFDLTLGAGEVVAYRVSPGEKRFSTGLVSILYVLGGVALISGYVVMLVGLSLEDDTRVAVGASLLVGGILSGILAYVLGRRRDEPSYEEVAHLPPLPPSQSAQPAPPPSATAPPVQTPPVPTPPGAVPPGPAPDTVSPPPGYDLPPVPPPP